MNYADLTTLLQGWAAHHPERLRLDSLGQSHEGREIWCLTVTRFVTGEARRKPAVWVDGNIHATEFSATSACLHLVASLLSQDDAGDEAIRELLDTKAFYVVPRVCPDGAELAFATPPRFVRSSLRPYPFEEPAIEGWDVQDVDGDGRILTIRMPDPDGPWKLCKAEPRLLERRQPEDREGPFYRCLPEGDFRHTWDGVTIKAAPLTEQLDLNRNFPLNWRQEIDQPGSGPYPASEPEVRAVVHFVAHHPNICHAVTYHTFSGCFLRPYSTLPDEKMPREDLDLYKFIGNKGTELTGYPVMCVYHDFRYNPNETITGSFDDWAYEHMGAFAWTTEIWSAFRAAGLTEGFSADTARGKHRFLTWFDEHPMADESKLLEWSDRELDGRGFQDWQPFLHPQLGAVEIGGWDMFYAWRNPPEKYLEKEVSALTDWVTWMAKTMPELALHRSRCQPLGNDHYRLELVLENRGWLPSYVTKKALQRKLVRPLIVDLELPQGVQLITGQLRTEAGQLEGKAYKSSSPFWNRNDYTDNRVKLDWVVKGPTGASIGARARHDRCGSLEVHFILP
jgi:murein tripeptide amidase MpaA